MEGRRGKVQAFAMDKKQQTLEGATGTTLARFTGLLDKSCEDIEHPSERYVWFQGLAAPQP